MSGEYDEQLPEDLREWVEQRAQSSELERADVLARAVAAYRFLEDEDETLALGDGQGELIATRDVIERFESLGDRVDDLDAELDEKIDDVRERVIQVKREADEKAPADHDHEKLGQQLEQTRRELREIRETTDDLEETVDDGFENFEEVLEYLTDTTDDLEEHVDTLARAIIDLRGRVREVEGDVSSRKVLADIQSEANRGGISTAKCADCGSKVQLGLLSSPSCPHCGSPFQDVEPASSFFGTATLTTGGHPQLESGEPESEPESPDELFDADGAIE
ncbi:MAG: CopG family transcriptional regulator [Haloferacaceae archaeon]